VAESAEFLLLGSGGIGVDSSMKRNILFITGEDTMPLVPQAQLQDRIFIVQDT
jgi:hypothetical protein